MALALSTIGEWVGSAIISNLVDTASFYLGEHMLPADTESELQTVKAALPKIAVVMGVGEALKLKHPNSGVNAWLEQFKEAFLAAEDVLDELKYWELEDMVKARDQVSGSSTSIIDSLKRKFPGSKISKDTLKRLRKAVQMLNLAVADIGLFFQFATALGFAKPNNDNVYTSSRETTSFLTETKVVGRETERALIIEWLKKPASHGNISSLCIVGVGGLGKTTLAQLIFEEISRENQFNKTIWVCVSTSFSIVDITRKILEELGEKCHDTESLNCLQIKLKEKVLSKKILFVLDDVWNDDKIHDWELLIAPLRFVQQESKILLTTRMKSVADMLARVLNVERENLVLEGLKEQELLELFNKYAFSGYNPNNHKDLQKIGNDIVKKLRGSPLATKVIGSLLNSNMNSNYWRRILNHDSLINLEQCKDVADVLKLSYYHLPAHLQECFRFCSIFPQDDRFEKDELIKMWMASGFIRQVLRGEERPEDIGEEYFNHLCRKSFFEQQFDGYVMHDLIHDLAQNVSEGECCRVEPNGKFDNIPRTAQHVSIPESKIERIFNLRNLRTLVITLSQDHINRDRFVPPNGSLKETLRLLVIQNSGRCELPEEIGSLLHLRFLKLSLCMDQPYRYLLPNSIYKLYHLQVLEMFGDWAINSVDEDVETTGMTNLVSLRYMNIPEKLKKNIHGVHKLTSLQELDFCVRRESGHHIDELGMLNNLRSLSIQEINTVGDPVEATNANLSKKESLISLSLNWIRFHYSNDPEQVINNPEQVINNPEQVIDNLQPNRNLKELTIKYYNGNKSPNWMRDSSHLCLSSLTLDNCHHWETLPFLGKIPHLKQLSLRNLREVKEVDYSCDSTSDCAFPSLERLHCVNMPKWESWAGSQSCYGFPNLKKLLIKECPNLAKLPAIPFSLFKFEVENVGLNSLPDMHHGSSITTPAPLCLKSLLKEVTISGCLKLTSLNGFLQQEDLDLQAIEKLTIKNCNRILRLPTERFEKLACLKYLHFGYDFSQYSIICPNLNQLPKIPLSLNGFTIRNVGVSDLPEYFQNSRSSSPTSSSLKASLRVVEIYNCPRLTSLNGFLQQESIDLRGLEKLAIEDCKNLVQLPAGAFGNFGSLKHLVINRSPNLNKLPKIPLSLNGFTIRNVGVSDLPEYFQNSRSSSPTSSSLKASLRVVEIYNCPRLTSLNGFLQQENIDLRGFEKLAIEDCNDLVQLPTGAFGNFGSLKHLVIKGSPNLNKLPKIPLSLNGFTIRNVGVSDLPEYFQNSRSSSPTSSSLKASLRDVEIYNCPRLTSLNGFLQQENIDLRGFEKLAIEDCNDLVQLPTGAFGNFGSLKHLVIKGSPNLNKLPKIPLSLNGFTIRNVGVSDLPEYFQNSRSSSPTSSSLKASLRDVEIYNCPRLTSLNGFLQQESIDLRGLEKLAIEDCKNLVQLPAGAFGNFGSLKRLVIKGSRNLITGDNQSIFLPVNLESLEIGNCGELDVSLLESASQLSKLATLSIQNSANITCIPSSENAFTSLSSLNIRGCDKLIEISSMPQAHTVNTGNDLVSLKIRYLYIDHLCLLLIEPLRCLRFVSHLEVEKCSGLEALPEHWLLQNSSTLNILTIYDASSLRSLPGTMMMLTALERLLINNSTLLEEVPELPTSLRYFYRDWERISLGKAL